MLAELGKHIADRMFELKPETTAPYVALSNIFAAAGRWDDVVNVRNTMVKGVKKNPGCSWIEVRSKVHTILTGDQSHLQRDKIYTNIRRVN